MILRLASRSCWSGWARRPSRAYDLTRWCPSAQLEDLVELLLVAGEFGGFAACLGPAAGGGVDQYGLADGGELAEKLADAEVQAGAGGLAAHEVGDLQAEPAGEAVHADVVLGPLELRSHHHHVRL